MYHTVYELRKELLNALTSGKLSSKKMRAYAITYRALGEAFLDNEIINVEPSRGGFICNLGSATEIAVKRILKNEFSNETSDFIGNDKNCSYMDGSDITIDGVKFNIVMSTTYSLASVKKYQTFDKYIVISDLGVKVVDRDKIKIATNGKISNKQPHGECMDWLSNLLGI